MKIISRSISAGTKSHRQNQIFTQQQQISLSAGMKNIISKMKIGEQQQQRDDTESTGTK